MTANLLINKYVTSKSLFLKDLAGIAPKGNNILGKMKSRG